MTHEFAEVGGAAIRYEVRGAGPHVVLIHAGINDLWMWDEQMGPIAERHRVIRYDVRGSGRSADPSGPFSDHDDLRGLLSRLGVSRTALVGCSGGGKIALDFALLHPEMVDKLVLASPGLGGFEWTKSGFEAEADAMREAFMRGDVERAAELWTRVWVDGPTRSATEVEPTVRDRAYDMLVRSLRRLAQSEAVRSEIEPPAIERLGDVEAPTLVILGQHDVPDIRTVGELLVNRIPDARLVSVDDAGHLVAMEKPATFNRLVLDFLAETTPSGS